MDIQLIQGKFSKPEAIDLITQLVHVKIKFHENKIYNSMNEEDIKMREDKIKFLQKELFEAREEIEKMDNKITLNSPIDIVKE